MMERYDVLSTQEVEAILKEARDKMAKDAPGFLNGEPTTHAGKILEEASKTFTNRRAIYGDNYLLVGAVMKGFFPNGITLKTEDDFNRFHIFMLGVVKQTRYVINWDKRGHADSIHDQVVYGAMLEAIDANGPVS